MTFWKYFKTLWQLFRGYNLLIIVLIMILFRYFLILPILNQYNCSNIFPFFEWLFFVISIVCIAAGGNCINDYYDILSDKINKKKKKVLGEKIPPKMGLKIYYTITCIGIISSIIPAFVEQSFTFFLGFLFAAILLEEYSSKWKRKPLIGNVIIAFLSSLSIILLFSIPIEINTQNELMVQNLYFCMAFYGGFSFLFTLIRELIKTMEDIQGDSKAHYRTIAVVWGIKKTKKMVLFLIVFANICLIILCSYLFLYQYFIPAVFLFISIICPCFILLYKTNKIKNSKNCHQLSVFSKLIMLMGILSSVVVYWYFLK